MKRVVVALGGNALLRRGESMAAEAQRRNVAVAARAIAELAADNQVVVTHGNGPQVGLLALQAAAYKRVTPYPLDVLGAESEGMIGYVIEQELANRLPGRQVATLLTQVAVDSDDPAFANPSKPIGPVYTEPDARRVAAETGWTVAPHGGGFRRVVPSPAPRRVLELSAIRLLVEASVVVICAGGGGVPVVIGDDGAVRGVEAVIDKDGAAALLALELGADALLILTDVPALCTDWRTPAMRAVRRANPTALRDHVFEEGSMAPKVAAACRFVEVTGGTAGIGSLSDAAGILDGKAGTTIRADNEPMDWYPKGRALP